MALLFPPNIQVNIMDGKWCFVSLLALMAMVLPISGAQAVPEPIPDPMNGEEPPVPDQSDVERIWTAVWTALREVGDEIKNEVGDQAPLNNSSPLGLETLMDELEDLPERTYYEGELPVGTPVLTCDILIIDVFIAILPEVTPYIQEECISNGLPSIPPRIPPQLPESRLDARL